MVRASTSRKNKPGFWESLGTHNYRNPVARSGRLTWQVGTVAMREETATARTITLDRARRQPAVWTSGLTAEDRPSGRTQPPPHPDRLELTVQRLGEASPST